MEWSNGGLHQFFVNPAGNEWQETLVALEQIGACRIKKIFESAIAVFPSSCPSTDQMARGKQLDDAGATAVATLDRLDEEYMALYRSHPEEDSYARMAEFLRRHGEGLAKHCTGPGPRRSV